MEEGNVGLHVLPSCPYVVGRKVFFGNDFREASVEPLSDAREHFRSEGISRPGGDGGVGQDDDLVLRGRFESGIRSPFSFPMDANERFEKRPIDFVRAFGGRLPVG